MTSEAQQPLFIEVAPDFFEFCGDTFEQHVDQWQEVDAEVQKDKWKLSAVAASLKTRYNDKTVDRFAYETRRSARTIRDYAQTYRAFENGGRLPILSFSHHLAASRHENPVEAIEKAHDLEWSVDGLEYWVKTGIEPDQRKKQTKERDSLKPCPELQKIHDDAVRAELDERIGVVRAWTEPADPVLSAVYHRLAEALEWQRDRTVDRDCAVIVSMFAGNDTDEDGVDCASDLDVQVWLRTRFFIMSEPDTKSRIQLMLKVKMLQAVSRERSRGKKQRGKITDVYEVHPGYWAKMVAADERNELPPTATELLKEMEPEAVSNAA